MAKWQTIAFIFTSILMRLIINTLSLFVHQEQYTALKLIWIQAPNQSPPWSYKAGPCQVWRHITMSMVLTQKEIPEERELKKKLSIV